MTSGTGHEFAPTNRVIDPPQNQDEAEALRRAIANRQERLQGVAAVIAIPLLQRIALAQDQARLAIWEARQEADHA